jgi:hypothetical protein
LSGDGGGTGAVLWGRIRIDGREHVLGVAGSAREARKVPLRHTQPGDWLRYSLAGGVLVIEWRNVATLHVSTIAGGAPAGNRPIARARA